MEKRIAAGLFILALCDAFSPVRAANEVPTMAAGQAFLAANAKKPGVVLRPDGLQYRVLHSAPGPRPALGDAVQIAYTGRLINGTAVDGSAPGLPITLSVGGAIRGLNEALLQMHVGDRWEVVIPPDLAFGASGSSNGAVPPDQTLVFDLTLVSRTAAANVTTDAGGHISVSPYNRQQGTTRTQGAVVTIPQ
jgi:FKBP-type peptidyl-prolyl cis-trans isomerase